MNTGLEIFCFVIVLIYCVFLIITAFAFFVRKKPPLQAAIARTVTVVIAARNEESNIESLLFGLESQVCALPFDIVVVNDNSTDRTRELAQQFADVSKRQVSVIDSPGQGKKAALTFGIQHSESELILVTDADCIPDSEWITSHVSNFADERVQLSCGMVSHTKRSSWLRDVLQIEMIFLQIVSAGLHQLKIPSMCNGASMAFRRTFFIRSGGFSDDQYASGDDIFLLQKALKAGSETIAWNSNHNGIVRTHSASAFREAVEQRRRWLSKIGGYSGWAMLLSGPMFLAVQMILPAALISPLVYGTLLNPIMVVFCIKSLVELLLLSLAVPFFGEEKVILKFPLAVVVYDLISLATAAGMLKRNIMWKGRTLERGKVK